MCSCHFSYSGRLRLENYLSSGVQGQHRQHNPPQRNLSFLSTFVKWVISLNYSLMGCPQATQFLALASVTLTKELWTWMVTSGCLAATVKELRGENLQGLLSFKICDPITDLDEKLHSWFWPKGFLVSIISSSASFCYCLFHKL